MTSNPYTYRTNFMGPVTTWAGFVCGRIDVSGGNLGYFGTEIGVPLIDEESWHGITEMLSDTNFKTEKLYSFEEIVEEYEKRSCRIVKFQG